MAIFGRGYFIIAQSKSDPSLVILGPKREKAQDVLPADQWSYRPLLDKPKYVWTTFFNILNIFKIFQQSLAF